MSHHGMQRDGRGYQRPEEPQAGPFGQTFRARGCVMQGVWAIAVLLALATIALLALAVRTWLA